jgi:ABC-type Mn2+/Zn2+ transport system permease subunit
LVGLLISYHYRTAAGATMALASVSIFFLGLFTHNFRLRSVAA